MMTERKFKKTMALTQEGDIAIDEQNRPFFRVNRPAAVQQLRVRLETVQGEDFFEPERGLRLFGIAGAPDPILEREIRFTLDSHPWVDSVEEISIESAEGGTQRGRDVTVGVELIDGEFQEFEVNFDE